MMKSTLPDRLLLVFVMEISALLVAVSSADGLAGFFAASPYDDARASNVIAAALVVAWIAIPIVLLVPGLVERPDRFVQRAGWAVLASGVACALLAPPGTAAVTLSLLGALLATYSRRHQP